MKKFSIIAACLLAASASFAQGANNQSNNPAPDNANAQAQGQQRTTEQIAQQIRTNLQQAGFKNIRMVPGSFIVRADDQNNNPVMMVINPDSVTTVSGINQSRQTTTGQAPSNGSGSTPHQAGQ